MATVEELLSAQHGVVLHAQLAALATDRSHLRRLRRRLRPVLRGAYARRGDPDPLLAHRAAHLLLPGLVFRGWTALHLLGIQETGPARLQVYVDQSADASDRPELAVARTDLASLSRLTVAGLPVVTPARAAVDLASRSSRADGLAVLDRVLRHGRADREALRVELRPRARGVVQARELLELADGRAESPAESWVRLHLHDGGVPAPTLQHEIRDGGRFVARVDMAWPAVKLYLEYDGLVAHSGELAFRRDRQRQNELLALGWVCLRFTAEDLRAPRLLARRVQDELRRLGHPTAA